MTQSYWITPYGDVINAPEGHLSYIKENWQAHDLPADISLTDLITQGWVRISGPTVVIKQIDNPDVFENLKYLLLSLGLPEYDVWIGNRSYPISLEQIKDYSFEDIYQDILAGRLELVLADAFDQGLFEVQPSWNETDSGGSTAPKERSYRYMPQDFTKEVWWSREMLDYMKKNFPGKKDVIPPEPDQGYPTYAWQVVKRLQKKAVEQDIKVGDMVTFNDDYELIEVDTMGVAYIQKGETGKVIDKRETYSGFINFIINVKTRGFDWNVSANEYKLDKLADTKEITEWEERWHKESKLNKKARGISVYSERGNVDYNPESGYFTAYAEGWWGPDDFTMPGIYALIKPDKDYITFKQEILNDIKRANYEYANYPITDTDIYWVYLGNKGYYGLTGQMGQSTPWDEVEESFIDEEGKDVSVMGYYSMKPEDVEKEISRTLKELSENKSDEQLAKDSKENWFETFWDNIDGNVDKQFVPYDEQYEKYFKKEETPSEEIEKWEERWHKGG